MKFIVNAHYFVWCVFLVEKIFGRKGENMSVKNKDKGATVSAPSRTITADEVRIENGVFVDEEGNIAERVAGLLVNPSDCFKVTIKIELPDDEESE